MKCDPAPGTCDRDQLYRGTRGVDSWERTTSTNDNKCLAKSAIEILPLEQKYVSD